MKILGFFVHPKPPPRSRAAPASTSPATASAAWWATRATPARAAAGAIWARPRWVTPAPGENAQERWGKHWKPLEKNLKFGVLRCWLNWFHIDNTLKNENCLEPWAWKCSGWFWKWGVRMKGGFDEKSE